MKNNWNTMELRRLSICLAFFMLSVLSQNSEARHSSMMKKRASDYDEVPMSDGADDDMMNDYAQNDADGGDEDDEVAENAVILTQPLDYQPNVGETVRLACKVQPAESAVITWSKDSEQLFFGQSKIKTSADRYSLSNTDLILKDVTPEDIGTYTCTVIQKKPVTVSHKVFVIQPAKIIRLTATNTTVKEGSDVLLTCDATGSPPPSVHWSRSTDGGNTTTALTDADGQFSRNTLFIENVKKEDSGIYYCLAANSPSQEPAIQDITITVAGKPKVRAHKTVVNADVGTEAELTCSTHEYHGQPSPHIHWYKDGRPIEDTLPQFDINNEGSRSTLIVKPKSDSDFGTYTCTAKNGHGEHSKSIDLVQKPVIEDLNADGPKLSWTIHSHKKLHQIELQLRNVNESNWTLKTIPIPESMDNHRYQIIYELSNDSFKDGQYQAVARAMNEKGWSAHSEPVDVSIESQPQPIQTASIARGINAAHSMRPASAVLSTVLMYLLVRMI